MKERSDPSQALPMQTIPAGRYIPLNTMIYKNEYILTTATGHESGNVAGFLLGEENLPDYL